MKYEVELSANHRAKFGKNAHMIVPLRIDGKLEYLRYDQKLTITAEQKKQLDKYSDGAFITIRPAIDEEVFEKLSDSAKKEIEAATEQVTQEKDQYQSLKDRILELMKQGKSVSEISDDTGMPDMVVRAIIEPSGKPDKDAEVRDEIKKTKKSESSKNKKGEK